MKKCSFCYALLFSRDNTYWRNGKFSCLQKENSAFNSRFAVTKSILSNTSNSMGGLKGHVIPGIMFVSFSIWWLIGEVLQKDRKGRNPNSPRLKTRSAAIQRVWYLCPGPTISKIPVEPMTKVILSVIGVLAELPLANSVTLYDVDGEFMAKNLPNYSHATVYCFFGLSGGG